MDDPVVGIGNWQRAGFGLYVHWPFCAAKCPYCDFNSHVSATIDEDAWTSAMLAELDRVADPTRGRVLSSVFFGGGTPSLMPPRLVAAVLDRASAHWTMANDVEVTLEANPTSVEADRLHDFRTAGVNRISLGLQALDDHALRLLGRQHSAAEGRAAFSTASSLFDRVSIDLIYARQHQPLAGWIDELRDALDLAGEHLSLYQLTIEQGTPFERRHRVGRLRGLPHEDLSADMYELTQELCAASGLPSYEVSNHARPGAESRHNMIYWRGGDWTAIGPGAHGRVSLGHRRWASAAIRSPAAWMQKVRDGQAPLEENRRQSSEEIAEEYLMTSLRLREGTDLGHLRGLGKALVEAPLQEMIESGLVLRDDGRIRTSPAGAQLLDSVLRILTIETMGQELA